MSFFDAFRHRIRSVFRAGDAARERDDEFAFHESLAMQNLGNDASAAKREFGNATYVKEEVRWLGAMRWIDAISQDVRYGLRSMLRAPIFTFVAVLSIGLGVGANTAVFGIVYSLLLERLPIPHASELVMLRRAQVGFGEFFHPDEYRALKATPGVSIMAASQTFGVSAGIAGTRVNVPMEFVDGSYYPLLGMSPAAGRFITADDDSSGRQVMVVTWGFAVRHFGSAEAALGKLVHIQRTPVSIIGVTPRGYRGLEITNTPEAAVPYSSRQLVGSRGETPVFILTRSTSPTSGAIAALQGTFGNCCAEGQLQGRQSFFERNVKHSLEVVDASRGISAGKVDIRAAFRTALLALMGGVVLLLLIVCTNVGSLQLSRAVVRSRELAVRLSLGASRGRIVRQLFVESLLLATLGAALGVGFAVWGSGLLSRNMPGAVSILSQFVAVEPQPPILMFTLGVAVLCALFFGVLPAVRATRFDLNSQLRDVRRSLARVGRLDRGIVAVQVAGALVLATGAGLMGATFRNLAGNLSSMDPDRAMIVQLDTRGTTLDSTPLRPLYDNLSARFRRVPGVRIVAGTSLAPLIFGGSSMSALDVQGFESEDNDRMMVGTAAVMPDYFNAMNVAVKGRDFTEQDVTGAEPVMIVSQRVAERFFPGRDPIGQSVKWRGRNTAIRIVGVAQDVKYFNLRADAPMQIYEPWRQQQNDGAFGQRLIFAIRSDVPAAKLVAAMRDIITAEYPTIRIRHVHPVTALAALQLGREQALASLSLIFGIIAVSLAAIGLYGVLAFHVTTRRREIGVRMALGANQNTVVGMVIRQSLIVVAGGAVIGIPLSLLASRSLRALLYGIGPANPVPMLIAGGALAAAGLLAGFLPARTAANVDPLIAMRAD
jgi:predicted permease